jgi:hypothetical protein
MVHDSIRCFWATWKRAASTSTAASWAAATGEPGRVRLALKRPAARGRIVKASGRGGLVDLRRRTSPRASGAAPWGLWRSLRAGRPGCSHAVISVAMLAPVAPRRRPPRLSRAASWKPGATVPTRRPRCGDAGRGELRSDLRDLRATAARLGLGPVRSTTSKRRPRGSRPGRGPVGLGGLPASRSPCVPTGTLPRSNSYAAASLREPSALFQERPADFQLRKVRTFSYGMRTFSYASADFQLRLYRLKMASGLFLPKKKGPNSTKTANSERGRRPETGRRAGRRRSRRASRALDLRNASGHERRLELATERPAGIAAAIASSDRGGRQDRASGAAEVRDRMRYNPAHGADYGRAT